MFILPSIWEGMPNALMEAMATGLVCVASRNRGTDDLLEGIRLLFDAGNVSDLVEKLQLALSSDCSDEVQRNTEHLRSFDINNTLRLVQGFYLDAVK